MTDNELIRMLRTCPYTECPNCEVRAVCDNFDNNNGRLDAFIADRLEALLDEVERLKDQLPKWVSVEERLPETELEMATADEPDDAITCEISVRTLVVDRTGKVRVARYELGPHFQGWQENGRAVGEVTHWMPLPSTEGVE